MANWEIKKTKPSEINRGNKFINGDSVGADDINAVVQAALYAQEQERLTLSAYSSTTKAPIILGGSGQPVIINCDNNTITFSADTLIFYPSENKQSYVNLQSSVQLSCNFSGKTSAFSIVYDKSTAALKAVAYSEAWSENYVLIAKIRKNDTTCLVNISCPYSVIQNGKTYTNWVEDIVYSSYLAPLFCGLEDKYVVVDTSTSTIKFPNDTIIVDPRQAKNNIQGKRAHYILNDTYGNRSCKYSNYTTSSAVKIFFDTTTNSLFATAFDNAQGTSLKTVNQSILLAIIRTSQKQVSCTIPYKFDGSVQGDLVNEDMLRRSRIATILCGVSDKYLIVDTANGTVTFPNDTVIVDPIGKQKNEQGKKDRYYVLDDSYANRTCKYTNYVTQQSGTHTSAIKIYFDPTKNNLYATTYSDQRFDTENKLPVTDKTEGAILLAMIRTSEKQASCTIPYIFDGLLNGEKITEDYRDIRCISHRGYYTAPENTISAFKLSKEKGYTFVECDVSFTKDNVPVLLHDSTVDRTSNGSGNISNFTLAEVRALDFGSWKSAEYAGEKIPTFEEFIAFCKAYKIHPYIELKWDDRIKTEHIANLVNIVQTYGMLENVTWISYSNGYLDWVRAVDQNARIGWIINDPYDKTYAGAVEWCKQKNTSNAEAYVNASIYYIDEAFVSSCIENGVRLECYTYNKANMGTKIHPYISAFTTDDITRIDFSGKADIGEVKLLKKEIAELRLALQNLGAL